MPKQRAGWAGNLDLNGILHKLHIAAIYSLKGRRALKDYTELRVWAGRAAKEGQLSSSLFEPWYTSYFGLSETFYKGKKILDVGCGPRGSLEWAQMAAERIGLDPIAAQYRTLGNAAHQMDYVAGCAEALPFADNHFDVISSFNSLKHVEDLELAVSEIIRVLAPGGTFLLFTPVGARKTIREPMVFDWDLPRQFTPQLAIVDEQHYERFFRYRDDPEDFIPLMEKRVGYDHSNSTPRLGILSVNFLKPSSGE